MAEGPVSKSHIPWRPPVGETPSGLRMASYVVRGTRLLQLRQHVSDESQQGLERFKIPGLTGDHVLDTPCHMAPCNVRVGVQLDDKGMFRGQ
jgi:hypothetical protein